MLVMDCFVVSASRILLYLIFSGSSTWYEWFVVEVYR
jgi:hypothetical protein